MELTPLNVPEPDVDMADESEEVRRLKEGANADNAPTGKKSMSTTFWDTVSTVPGVRAAWQVAELARGTLLLNSSQEACLLSCRTMHT